MNHPGTLFHKKAPTLPFFVTASQSLRHYWKAPLLLETTFPIQIAQFSLHSRVQRSFACLTWESIPANVSTWLEGDMFYLKHKRNLFKSDYLVLKKTSCNEYTSVLAFNNKELDKDYGTLFRLHPYTFKDTGEAGSSIHHKEATVTVSEY